MEGFGAGIFIPKTFVSLQLTKNKCAKFRSQICVVLESEVDSSSLDNPRSEFTSRNTKQHKNLGLHYIKTHSQKWNEKWDDLYLHYGCLQARSSGTVLVIVMNLVSIYRMCPSRQESDESV